MTPQDRHAETGFIEQGCIQMKKALVAFVAGLVAISSAYAAEMAGTVKAFNAETNTVMLEDGSELVLAEGVDAAAFVEGAKLMLMVDDASGQVVEAKAAE